MKTTGKRRMLISSVAMLLVAMLALGTATFAWFTTDTSTTAQGINVETTKKSLLLVSSRTSTWTDNLNYGFTQQMQPASSYDGINWYKAIADKGTSYKATTADKLTGMTTDDVKPYVFYNMLNVKNDGKETTKGDVKITASVNEVPATEGKNYLRVALVPSTATTDAERATATVESAESFRANIYGTGSAKPVASVDASKNIVEASSAVTAKGTEISVNLGKLSAGQAKYYMLMVWFEGQSEACSDAFAGNKMPTITFNIGEDVA